MTFRSLAEVAFAKHLDEHQVDWQYESEVWEYEVPASFHKYTNDFQLKKKDGTIMYIEYKGKLTAEERKKLKIISTLCKGILGNDLRVVFMYANQKIRKGSKTTYGQWATKVGILWADKCLPSEWIKELKTA